MRDNSIQIMNVARNILILLLITSFANYTISYYFNISISDAFLYSAVFLMLIGTFSWIINLNAGKKSSLTTPIKFNFREANFGQNKPSKSKSNSMDFLLFMVVTGALLFFIGAVLK